MVQCVWRKQDLCDNHKEHSESADEKAIKRIRPLTASMASQTKFNPER